jgi:hypothetical protein
VTHQQIEELLSKPSCTVSEFAAVFGLSRNAAYEAIQRRNVKSLRFGKRIVVPTAPLRKMLGLDEATDQNR